MNPAAPSRMFATKHHQSKSNGFTLLELLLSMTILAILMLLILNLLNSTQNTVTTQQARVSEFKEARAALETISRSLSEAVINSYWAYGDYNTPGKVNYTRQSDGHFICGPSALVIGAGATAPGHSIFFQSTSGRTILSPTNGTSPSVLGSPYNLLSCLGYYVDFNTDLSTRPGFLQTALTVNPERKRFRLMEFRLPPEKSILYSRGLALNAPGTSKDQTYKWFRGPFLETNAPTTTTPDPNAPTPLAQNSWVLSENILALIMVPRYTVTKVSAVSESTSESKENSTTTTLPAENYIFDSRGALFGEVGDKARATLHQLPPVIEVTIVAVEEKSFEKLVAQKGSEPLANAVKGAFENLFVTHQSYDADMETLSAKLTELKLNHRFFTTNVSLRGAKWVVEEKTTPGTSSGS